MLTNDVYWIQFQLCSIVEFLYVVNTAYDKESSVPYYGELVDQ